MDLQTTSTIKKIAAQREAAINGMAAAFDQIDTAYKSAELVSENLRQAVLGARVHYEASQWDKERLGVFYSPKVLKDRAECLAAWRRDVDVRVWQFLMDGAGISDLMDATAKEEMRKSYDGNVAEATEDNIRATVETLLGDRTTIWRRGIATAFSRLDRRFKSHDAFKIGSRVILNNCFNDWGSWSYRVAGHDMKDVLNDIDRVFHQLDGKQHVSMSLIKSIDESRAGKPGFTTSQSECETDYFKVRVFMNGNVHLWLRRDDLVEKVNQELAAYYGPIIPDGVAPDGATYGFERDRGRAVSRDLAFYKTPPAVVERLLDGVHLGEGAQVLEPSAGDGAIANAVAKLGARVTAVEVDQGRFLTLLRARNKNVLAYHQNFLTWGSHTAFDVVLMNPPFYGMHWMDHVTKSFDHLADGGTLRAVLPITARVGSTKKHQQFQAWAKKNSPRWGCLWRDLPSGSFADSGTNVETTILEMRKRR